MNQLGRLQELFSALGVEDRHALLRYAEYLHESAGVEGDSGGRQEPLDLPRPDDERVVMAIRRLAKSYPMLNHDRLLRQSADLMSAHLVNGRAAVEVIDELEEIFQQHYQRYLDG